MNIVLFGGAFDPPHIGHQKITQTLLTQKIADEVWYVPAGEHAFSKKMSPANHRLAMLDLVLKSHQQAGFNQVKIETYELDKDGVSYTHETLDHLSVKYPKHSFSWLIGSDNLEKFHTWGDGRGNSYTDVLANYKFYVYPRKEFSMKPLYEGMESLVEVEGIEEMGFSSTEIRELVGLGEDIKRLVSEKVEKYILKNNLYKS